MKDLPPLTLTESEMRSIMADVGKMIVDHFVGLSNQPVTKPSTLAHLRGGSAAISKTGRGLLAEMNRADSLSIDPHKWMFQPYEIGCALIRNQEHLKDTFKVSAENLKIMEQSAEQPNFNDYGVQPHLPVRCKKHERRSTQPTQFGYGQ